MPATEHDYILRRQLLQTLRQYRPAACTLPRLLEAIPMADPAVAQEVRQALADMATWGFVRNANGGLGEPWWTLTAEGLSQITGEATLDRRIWGELTVR